MREGSAREIASVGPARRDRPRSRAARRLASWAACLLVAVGLIGAAPAPVADDGLDPGQFLWTPELSPHGPVVIVVSLPAQRAYVYRNGVRIGVSTVSTGRPGYETPTGVFTILQKRREHYSNLYDNAPMPFMQRLTWDGLALHAGGLPGYPASHGCVRLPPAFAQRLFGVTSAGTTVVIAADETHPPTVTSPGLFAPVDAVSGTAILPQPPGDVAYDWFPGRSPEGPLTILLSTRDARVVVMRNGIEIGRAAISVQEGLPPGTRAYVLLEGTRDEPSAVLPERPALRWMSVVLPGDQPSQANELRQAIREGRLSLPKEFASLVYDALRPGAAVVVTSESLHPAPPGVTVLSSGDNRPK